MTDFDTNLDNYDYTDLISLFDIEPQYSLEDTQKKTNDYIKELSKEDPDIINFFKMAQLKLLDTYNSKVKEGNKNPIKLELTSKHLCIDSRFRENNSIIDIQSTIDPTTNEDILSKNSETSNFTINLSETLKNVTKLKFFMLHIPFSWYNVYNQKNTFEIVLEGAVAPILITIEPGHYIINNDATDLKNIITAINNEIASTTLNAGTRFSYNPITGKVVFNNGEAVSLTINFIKNTSSVCMNKLKVDNHFGSILGFKKINYTIHATERIISEGFPNMVRTKYIIIEINDFNKNYVANKFVYATYRNQVVSLPDYYTPLNKQLGETEIPDHQINGTCVSDDVKNSGIHNNHKVVPLYNESYPRKMTQNQIYSLNEIIKSLANKKQIKQEFKATPNCFAHIPIDISQSSMVFGDSIVYNDDTASLNERIYFGPVDIERLHLRILDDNGEELDLNDAEWSMTLRVEHLYQY